MGVRGRAGGEAEVVDWIARARAARSSCRRCQILTGGNLGTEFCSGTAAEGFAATSCGMTALPFVA